MLQIVFSAFGHHRKKAKTEYKHSNYPFRVRHMFKSCTSTRHHLQVREFNCAHYAQLFQRAAQSKHQWTSAIWYNQFSPVCLVNSTNFHGHTWPLLLIACTFWKDMPDSTGSGGTKKRSLKSSKTRDRQFKTIQMHWRRKTPRAWTTLVNRLDHVHMRQKSWMQSKNRKTWVSTVLRRKYCNSIEHGIVRVCPVRWYNSSKQ